MTTIDLNIVDLTVTNEYDRNVSILFVKHGKYSSLELMPFDTTKTIIILPGKKALLPKEMFTEHVAFMKRGDSLTPLHNAVHILH
jgi:hypothetical protein